MNEMGVSTSHGTRSIVMVICQILPFNLTQMFLSVWII